MVKLPILRRRSTHLALTLGGGLVVWFSAATRYRDGLLDPAFWLAVLGWACLAAGILGLLFAQRGARDSGPPAA